MRSTPDTGIAATARRPSRGAPRAAPAALTAASLLAVAGCGGAPPPALPDPGGEGGSPTGLVGLIHVIAAGEGAELHAVFAAALPSTGVIDPVAALGEADAGCGYWTAPRDPGTMVEVAALDPGWVWTSETFYDAGESLWVGDLLAHRVTTWSDADWSVDGDLVLYRDDGDATSDALAPGAGLDLGWSGGADLAAAVCEGAATLPAAPILVTPAADGGEIRWIRDHALDLAWDVDGEERDGDEAWITVLGDARWLQGLASGREMSVPAAAMAEAVRDGGELRLARTALRELQVGPGSVLVRTTREVRLPIVPVGVLEVVPPVLELGSTAALEVTNHGGAFEDGQTEFDLGEGVVVVSAEVPGGSGTLARLEVVVADDAATGPRTVAATTAGESVVSEAAVEVLLPAADRCEDAFTLARDGLFHGDLAGLADDYDDPSSCTGLPAAGPDAVFAVEVVAGQVISATLDVPEGDASLYLVAACDQAQLPLACADLGGIGAAESLSLVVEEGLPGTLLLFVDLFNELAPEASGAYTLQVERGPL